MSIDPSRGVNSLSPIQEENFIEELENLKHYSIAQLEEYISRNDNNPWHFWKADIAKEEKKKHLKSEAP